MYKYITYPIMYIYTYIYICIILVPLKLVIFSTEADGGDPGDPGHVALPGLATGDGKPGGLRGCDGEMMV